MDIDTFLELPYQEKFKIIHLRDLPVGDYLRDIHQGKISFDGSDEAFDKLWAAEHLDHLLSSCRQSVGRMTYSDSPRYNTGALKLTAKFVLDTLVICDQLMAQIGLKPLSELNLGF